MSFFPEESELPTDSDKDNGVPDEVKILYATSDGWLVQTDVAMLESLEEIEVINGQKIGDDSKMFKAVSDLIAKQEPGSWMKLPHAILIVLGKETVKTFFGYPID